MQIVKSAASSSAPTPPYPTSDAENSDAACTMNTRPLPMKKECIVNRKVQRLHPGSNSNTSAQTIIAGGKTNSSEACPTTERTTVGDLNSVAFCFASPDEANQEYSETSDTTTRGEVPEEGIDVEFLNLKTARSKSFSPPSFAEHAIKLCQQSIKKPSSPTFSPASTISTSDLESPLDPPSAPPAALNHREADNVLPSVENFGEPKIHVIDESFFTEGDTRGSNCDGANPTGQGESKRSALQVACPGFGLQGDTQNEIRQALAFRRQKTLKSEIIWGSQDED